MEIIVKEIRVVAGLEHLSGKKQHGSQAYGDKRTTLEESSNHFPGLTLGMRCWLGIHTLLIPVVAQEEGYNGEERDEYHAGERMDIIHMALIAFPDNGIKAEQCHGW